ncbi:redoxin family protein [Ferrimonas sp.]|uniref:redoxin family protein n=1 Tax=Ferrimonas sp. TaxID=2080861 RepID=UPI003A925CD9
MSSKKIAAGQLFPAIEVTTTGGELITLGVPQSGADWQMVVVYRGRHCPLCTRYLNEIEKLKQEFFKLGVDIVAVSADSRAQVAAHLPELNVSYPIAFGLSVEQMQQLGLYISHPRSAQETDHPFAEPGLYVVNEQGQIQVLDLSNGPFARPELGILLSGLAFIRNPDNNYPIRGTYD